MNAQVGNIVDEWDSAVDEFEAQGGSMEEWQSIGLWAQIQRVDEVVSNRIADGFWFRWSDETVRDWPEN